jgi:hypothetical protein
MLIPIADIDRSMVKRSRPHPGGTIAEPCLICGRWLDPTTSYMVEYTTDGCIVWPVVPTMNSVENSQGGFPVGSDCYAKLRKYAIRAATGGA